MDLVKLAIVVCRKNNTVDRHGYLLPLVSILTSRAMRARLLAAVLYVV
jgi:hypothetical protein